MLVVVFHHSAPKGYETTGLFHLLTHTLHYPALAFFFLTSGLFAGRYAPGTYPAYLAKRALRLLLPWVFANLLMLVPKLLVEKLTGGTAHFSLGALAMSFLQPRGLGILPHLWFLPTLFILNAATPLFRPFGDKPAALKVALLFVLFVLSAIPISVPRILCLNDIRIYAFYFFLGFLFRDRWTIASLRLSAMTLLVVLSLLALYVLILNLHDCLGFAFRPCNTLVGLAFILLFSMVFSSRLAVFRRLFSSKTFIIYIYSLCFQNFVEVISLHLGFPLPVAATLNFLLGLALPMLMFSVLARADARWKLPAWFKAAFGV
ncbi:MAG: acyltransferase family protein [Kiritimatiellae bacterium]|nr:acyltransferase family protein [Kiritimatiellia bacterium]